MTVIDPGSARPGRLVGMVLIGIAVLAALLGVLALIDDGDGGGQGQPTSPPSTSVSGTPGPPSGTEPPPGSGTATPPATPPATSTASPTSQPGGQPTPPPGGQQPQPAPPNPRDVPVRVYNNGTITGLAAQAARDFRADGWNVVTIDNYKDGIIPTTTVYYRPGTEEEAAARELAARFNMRVEPRFPGIADAAPGVIVLVTNDYGGK